MTVSHANVIPILQNCKPVTETCVVWKCFFNDYTLIIIVQSIPGARLVRFGESSHELWRTFGFNIMVFYYVIIPGRESKKHFWMPTDVIQPHTKFQVDSVSVTWKIYQSLYRKIFYPSSGMALFWSVLSMYIVLHDYIIKSSEAKHN